MLGEIALVVVLVIIGILLSGLRIANEYERAVVFRLGRLMGLKGPGLYWLIPLGIEQQRKIDLRTNTVDVERQETITKDSVTIKVNVARSPEEAELQAQGVDVMAQMFERDTAAFTEDYDHNAEPGATAPEPVHAWRDRA